MSSALESRSIANPRRRTIAAGVPERGSTPRRSRLATGLALAALALALLAAPAASASPGPIAAYSFDEGSGATAHDLAGQADNATIEGGAAWSEAGKYGGAIDFDGKSGRLRIADTEQLDLTGHFTLEAWVRPDTSSGGAAIISKTQGTISNASGYLLSSAWSSGTPVGYVTNSGSIASAGSSSALPTEAWSHLTLTSDGEELRFYVNGELTGATSTTIADGASSADLMIGFNTFWSTYFAGLIDEVRIYDRALDQSEIEVSMARPVAPDLQQDRLDRRRDGSAYNANFDRDGVDDYRVDANIAVAQFGASKAEMEDHSLVDVVHRTDCVNPDPWRESLGEYELPDIENTTPDPEEPFWVPDPLLNEEHESSYYGCLENSGNWLPDQGPSEGIAEAAAGFEGSLADQPLLNGQRYSDLLSLGGVAPGAKVWSLRILAGGYNFGLYPAPFTYPVRFYGAGLGPVSNSSVPLRCDGSTFEAPSQFVGSKKVISDISPEYEDCATTDQAESEAEVNMNSCTYTLHVANTGPPYEGTLDIVCEEEDEIEIDVYGEGKAKAATCTETIPPQTELEGIELANNGKEGAERAIAVKGTLQGIKYEISGSCVESPREHSDGEFSLDTTLAASNGKEEPAGIFLVGSESELNRLKPKIENETEWLPDYGVSHLSAGLDWAISTREDSDPANDIDVVGTVSTCGRLGDPLIEESGNEAHACDSEVLGAKIGQAMDHGILVVDSAGESNTGGDVKTLTPQSIPDVLTAALVLDGDGKPGGKGGCDDDHRWSQVGFGLGVDISPAGCGTDTGTTSPEIAGAVADLASQCPAHDRAGAEYIVDTLMAEGDTGGIAEGGWQDDSGDGWKEPLLNLSNEEVFDPVMIDTETGKRNHEPESDCPWRSHQAESDVNSDGRADLVTIGGEAQAAEVFAGAYEGPEDAPARAGYETAAPAASLSGQLDPALLDGKGSYAIDTADVDGDRHADLITAATGTGKGVAVHLGDGEGKFGSAIESLKGTTFDFSGAEGSNEPIAVADVDGDGRADLVVHSSANHILTYPGKADGSFGSPVESSPTLDSALRDHQGDYFLDVTDVTGEELDDPEAEAIDYNAKHSYADLVVSDTDGTISVYPGKADGSFGSAIDAADVNPIFDDGKGEEIVGLGDVNRDRRADLLTLDGETLKLYDGQADGSFAAPSEPYAGNIDSSLLDGEGEELLGLLDYSRDGLADLVSVKADGTILAYTAQRDQSFASPEAQEGSVTSLHSDPAGHQFVAEKPYARDAGCAAGGCWWPTRPHLPRFEAETYPLTLTGEGLNNLTMLSTAIQCDHSHLEGTLSGPGKQLSLTPEYGECHTSGGAPVTALANGCHYTATAQNAGPPYTGTLGLACAKEEERIEFKVYTGTTLVCTLKVGPQSGLAGLQLANLGEGPERGIEINPEVKTLAYESKGLCGKNSKTDGVLGGKAVLSGVG